MKLSKRIISICLCALMLLGLSVTAMAAGSGYTLTINNSADNHIYEAYQIFTGDLTDVDGKEVLSNIVWGSAIVSSSYDKSADLLAAINADTKLTELHGATDAASLAEKVATITSDSATIDRFAEVVGKIIRGETTPASVASDPAGTSIDDGDVYKITGLGAGYYIIKDKDGSLNDKHEVYTKYIIRVVKDQTVTPKGDVPKVEKTINDTIDGTFTEHEDFDISDTAYYKWEGTLPSNLGSYENYYYKFTDEYSTGLTFGRLEQIYIEGSDGNRVHTFFDLHDTDTTNDTLPSGITSDAQTKENVQGKNSIYVEFANLLTLYPNILPTHKIIVKYSAMVNRDALIALPNPNEVDLVYSNNPNGTGNGKTKSDEAYAFTFQINVDKYDADDTGNKLEGAEFVLYYERIELVDEKENKVKHYAMVVTEEMLYDTDENGKLTTNLKSEADRTLNGKILEPNDIGVIYGWTTIRSEASVLDTNAEGKLNVRGLDKALYYLEETKAPAGYNLMETPVAINIIPTYSTDGKSVTVAYEVDSVSQTTDTVGVRNSSGSTLPVTGGVGTVIFYVIGAMLVLGAAVILVSKRRASADN